MQPPEPEFSIKVFISYAREDQETHEELVKHLSPLHRQGLIAAFYDRQIVAGTDWAKTINTHLETASLILLLVSETIRKWVLVLLLILL